MSYDEKKHITIVELFKQGKTQAEIGRMFSVSRQRISQVLARHGVTGAQGGQAARTEKRAAEKMAKRQKDCLEKHGCTLEQFAAVCTERPSGSISPHLVFIRQRNHAKARGVEWSLKFWDWFCVWQESGKWDARGRGAEAYCMCRVGDEGAYALGNVYIGSVIHNSTLGRTLAHERNRERKPLHRALLLAGGPKAVSEAIGVPREYLSQLANSGYMPRLWLADGRAEALASLTHGAFTVESLARTCQGTTVQEAA